ncbi:MAG: GntR family transcriptional regulator [Azoarcus sp.]|nr:GntR family transcriptional regulator [Azoarcus sp.]
MVQISPTFSPLYKQIKELILQALKSGEWRPGQVIPSEQELAARFSVSQGTVRKAIDEMATDNILIRRQGRGTYVASHTDPRQMFRFLRLVPEEGTLSHHPKSIPVDCRRAKAGSEAARMLNIAPSSPIIILRRMLKFGDEPIVADEIYLPEEIYKGLNLEMLQVWNSSLYSLFETRFGLRMIRAQERIRAVAADHQASELLQVPEGTPLLSVERVTYTYGDKPVEWRRGVYSTVGYYYLNDLT